jgi:hypothetical protein
MAEPGDAGLVVFDRHIWRMFREHLVPQLGCELIAAELVQPTLVLKRHAQEGDTSPFLIDPLYPAHITWHGGGTAVRVHHERQVLSRLEGFRETEATPPHCHIDHLPTGEPCLIRDDHPEIHNRSHRPPWFSPEYLRFLFGQLGYCSFHGEFLLRSVHPIYEWGSNSHAERIFLSRTHKFARL